MKYISRIESSLNLFRCLGLAMLLVFMASCNVHEFPSEFRQIENKEDEVSVKLSLNLSMAISYVYDTIYITRASASQRRFIIEVYNDTVTDNSLVDRTTILQDPADKSNLTTKLSLLPNKYKIAVWQDYVNEDGINPYYATSSTKSIHLPEPKDYKGDTDDKVCAASCVDVDLRPYRGLQEADILIEDTLRSPLARIEFITTDVSKYINNKSRDRSVSDLETALEHYTAQIVYYAYLPSGFNVVTNKPNDSSTGYSCETKLLQISPDEARVGFDYVLINSHVSFVDAQLVIYDDKGIEVNHSDPIHIPIKRGGTTYIYDEFLSKESNSGVRINYAFDGEHNVYIEW